MEVEDPFGDRLTVVGDSEAVGCPRLTVGFTEALRATLPVNPFRLVTVIVVCALVSLAILIEVGEEDILKSGVGGGAVPKFAVCGISGII